MIAFDLTCSQGHAFEGWFDNATAFEDQNSSRMVSCPICGDTDIRRILSPVALKKASSTRPASGPPAIDYQRLAKEVFKHLKENFENVGPRFASEALKIHYGVSDKRNIRGSATKEEEKVLAEEGVQFIKLPWPGPSDKDRQN